MKLAEKPYRVVTEPSPDEAAQLILESRRRDVVILFLRCEVEYAGRASSSLPLGDRVVMIKPDGAVLIHGGEKREPLNWQPPGSSITARVRKGMLEIVSVRRKPSEKLVITSPIVFVALAARCAADQLVVRGLERELVEAVLQEPSLIEPGFTPLKTEVSTPMGKVDLLGIDASGAPVFVEFKRGTAGIDAAVQLKRYVDHARKKHPNARGILAANSISPAAMRVLREGALEFRKLPLTQRKLA